MHEGLFGPTPIQDPTLRQKILEELFAHLNGKLSETDRRHIEKAFQLQIFPPALPVTDRTPRVLEEFLAWAVCRTTT